MKLAAVCSFALLLFLSPDVAAGNPHAGQSPELLSYDELVALNHGPVDTALEAKLQALLTTPFVSNEAYARDARPHSPEAAALGPVLRVLMWNIGRGIHLDEIIDLFTSRDRFLQRQRRLNKLMDAGELLRQIDALQRADVLVINEADWGMRRTGYRAVARELAEALDMNWAFGVEFVEVDPKSLGGETFEEIADERDRREMVAQLEVDRKRLRALHGTAVLSRYPIVDAELRPISTIGYDWYHGESTRISHLEKGKRSVAARVFLEKVARELRRGGRTCLYVTLDVPQLPEGRLVIAAPHLENRTDPKNRAAQIREVLEHIRDVRTPVVVAGDLNTTFRNTSPTSLRREFSRILGSSEFWASKGMKYATGLGLAYDVVTGGFKTLKNRDDPTASHIPLLASNPERHLFRLLEEWRFDDGRVFDFRGDRQRTVNRTAGTLANSNQRDRKGFATTYSVTRGLGPVGKLKLDWILVKPYIEDPRDRGQPYRFAPHLARTLAQVNQYLGEPLSDYHPISVELPFQEPGELRNRGGNRWWLWGE